MGWTWTVNELVELSYECHCGTMLDMPSNPARHALVEMIAPNIQGVAMDALPLAVVNQPCLPGFTTGGGPCRC